MSRFCLSSLEYSIKLHRLCSQGPVPYIRMANAQLFCKLCWIDAVHMKSILITLKHLYYKTVIIIES